MGTAAQIENAAPPPSQSSHWLPGGGHSTNLGMNEQIAVAVSVW